MNAEALETLSAFADGEPVATPALLDALRRPKAHEALIDFIRLREAMEEPRQRPRPEFVSRMRETLEPRAEPWWRRVVAVPAPLAVALAALIMATFLLVIQLRPSQGDAPPAPSRVLRFEEGVDWIRTSSNQAE